MSGRKILRSEDGAVLVEFAFAVPLLLLIVWCMVDFSRAYYTSNSLATAVREGARYAAVQSTPGASATVARIDSVVRRAFSPMGGDSITNNIITVVDSSTTGGYVAVSVNNYTWLKTTPLNLFTNGRILMTRRARFRWEREPTT